MRVDATIPSGLVEGRGQVNPGPSAYLRPLAPGLQLMLFLVATIAVVTQFIIGTLLVEQGERIPTAAATSLVLAAALLVFGHGSKPRHTGVLTSAACVALGAVLGAGVPLIYVLNQYSDAPSGTLVLWWTAVLPGALLLVAGAIRGLSTRLVLGALALMAMFSQAGVLGNWERPSSFSVLAKHIPQQLALAGGSVLLVVGLVLLARLAGIVGIRAAAQRAGLGALVAGFGLTAVSGDPLGALTAIVSPMTLAFALSATVVVAAAFFALAHDRAVAPASALLIAPSAMSLLIFVEAAVGALGPEPILRQPVLWSSAVGLFALGAAFVLEQSGPWIALAPSETAPTRLLVVRVVRVVALAGTILAGMGMAASALNVDVQGRYTDASRFAATFSMRGFETVGGWLALAAALVMLTVVFVRTRPMPQLFAGVSVIVAALAWRVVGSTPLHTWVTWIPADVQQDYGTEYAAIVFTPVPVWLQTAAIIVAALTALLAMIDGVARARGGEAAAEESGSE